MSPVLGCDSYSCCEHAPLFAAPVLLFLLKIYVGWSTCAWGSVSRNDSISSFSSQTWELIYVAAALGGLPYYLELLYLSIESTFRWFWNVPFPLGSALRSRVTRDPSEVNTCMIFFNSTWFSTTLIPLLDGNCMMVVAFVWVFKSHLIAFSLTWVHGVDFRLMYWTEPHRIANTCWV